MSDDISRVREAVHKALLKPDFVVKLRRAIDGERHGRSQHLYGVGESDFGDLTLAERLRCDGQAIPRLADKIERRLQRALSFPKPITAEDVTRHLLHQLGGRIWQSNDEFVVDLERSLWHAFSEISEGADEEAFGGPLDLGAWDYLQDPDDPDSEEPDDPFALLWTDGKWLRITVGFDPARYSELRASGLAATGMFWGYATQAAIAEVSEAFGEISKAVARVIALSATPREKGSEWHVADVDADVDRYEEWNPELTHKFGLDRLDPGRRIWPGYQVLIGESGRTIAKACFDALCAERRGDVAPLQGRLLTALRLFSSSNEQDSEAIQVLLAIASIESLICEDSRDTQKTAQLAHHVPALLQPQVRQRKTAERPILTLYDARSRVAHGSIFSASQKYAWLAQQLAAAVIRGVSHWINHCERNGFALNDTEFHVQLFNAYKKEYSLVDMPDLGALLPTSSELTE